MKRMILGIAAGIVGGATATWMWLGDPPQSGTPPSVVRDIRDVPQMSEQESVTHREQRFASLTTVAEILALPSDFDQTEALYVIAGRSDSAQLQHLIDQTNRVADASDRRAGLGVLFSRLSDIDPQSAVVMAGQMPYAAERSIDSSIWRAWARRDLDAALHAAIKLAPLSRKNRAAQSIYGAYGYAGNDTTAHIEDVLQIKPNRAVRGLYVQSLAADSTQSAIDYVNDLRPVNEQVSVAWTLGEYLGRTIAGQAEGYANQLKNAQARSNFERGVMRALASADPASLIERFLANPKAQKYGAELGNALQQLATTNLDQAMRYFDSAQSQQSRMMFGASIVKALAREDPLRAIEWAVQNDSSLQQELYQQAIVIVAATHPDIALEAVNEMTNNARRSGMIASIIGTMVQSDPMLALGALEQVPEGHDKQQAAQMVMMNWVHKDAQAAVEWAITNRKAYGADMLRSVSRTLIRQDPDAAMQILPRLDEQTAGEWSVRIVRTLANNRSIAAAESFMQQHKESPLYERMQVALIPQVAQSDLAAAKNMADNMSPGKERDIVYSQLVGQIAGSDPQQARVWLDSIENEHSRSRAVSGLVSNWAQSDSASATRWVTGLATGGMRDQAIASLVSSSRDPGEAHFALINSIDDDNLRLQAAMGAVSRSARDNPQRASAILKHLRLDESQRAQIDSMIEQFGLRQFW